MTDNDSIPARPDPCDAAAPAESSAAGAGRIGQRTVLGAASSITAAVLTSRVLGLIRESLFAAIFGAGKFADAFVLAFRIPNLLRELFAEGSMSSAFVPTFTAAMLQDGRERAYHLANVLISGLLLITGGLAVLGVIFAEQIVDFMAPGFGQDPQKHLKAIQAARIMMPFLPLITCAAAAMGMLNAQRRFFLPALAPAMFNVASIAVGLYLWGRGDPLERAILGWSIGAVIGAALQLGIQLPPLWRLGWRFRWSVRSFLAHPGVRRVGRLMGPATVGLAAIQINILVNSIFASNLGDGPMAQLNYAWRLFYLPLGLFGVAIATVTTATVAEEAARGDREALRNRVAHSLKLTWMLTLPSAIGLMAVSVPAIRVIFERGKFGPEDTIATAYVLMAYVVGLAPYSSVKTVVPAFYALDRPRLPMVASMTAVAANVTFNALTYRKLGAVGLATGTALGAIVNITVLTIALRFMVGPMRGQRVWSAGAKILAASVVTGAVAWVVWRLVEHRLPVDADALWLVSVARLTTLMIPVAVGLAVYVLTCRLLRLPEINEVIDPLRRRLHRR